MPPSFRPALAFCLLCLGACQRSADTDGATPPAPAPAPAGASATQASRPGGEAEAARARAGTPVAAARYACEGNTALVRNEDGSFRAELPGSPPVRLTRIAGSTPPVYTGASLYLRIGDAGAMLSQGDRADELRCTAD